MRFIFFDLETSDRNTIGQILNYAFIATDQYLEPRAELRGLIHLSRLQLPSPEAILVNRVNLLDHQRDAKLNEAQAMREVQRFIQTQIEEAERDNEQGGVALTGYNTARFDVPYLRTSLIRNGINPYFSGKLRYKDLLHLVRNVYLTNPAFPAPRSKQDASQLSLSLESVTRELGLLQAQQSHDSYQDVMLTIALARQLEISFKSKLHEFEAYQARTCEQASLREQVWQQRVPNYQLGEGARALDLPVALHATNHKEALWIDLTRYERGEKSKSLFWINKNSGAMFLSGSKPLQSAPAQELARRARADFAKIGLHNYFSQSTCDIEQDIYRMDFDSIAALELAIWHGNTEGLRQLKSRDARILFKRFQLANYCWGAESDKRMQKMLREYALYRYGGKIDLNKFHGAELNALPADKLTWPEFLDRFESLRKQAKDEDRVLLDALWSFYQRSDIFGVLSENTPQSSEKSE